MNDPFERGRDSHRDAIAEEEKRKRELAAARVSTSRRLHPLLNKKVRDLGFSIFGEPDSIFIHPFSIQNSSYRPDVSIGPYYANSERSTISFCKNGEFQDSKSNLTDDQVLEVVGNYCEANRDEPSLYIARMKAQEEESERRARKARSDKRSKFWSKNWGWVPILVVAAIVLADAIS